MAPDPDAMSISELRQYLDSSGANYTDCVEKKDLVKRAKEVAQRQASGGGGSSTSTERPYDPLRRNAPSSSGRPQPRAAPRAARPRPEEPEKKTEPDHSDRSEEANLVRKILKLKDYYEILGLQRGSCSESEIKKGYRKMALKLHPDKCKVGGGEEAFKLVSAAFDTLSDPDKRAHYDRTGSFNPHAAAGAGPGGGMPGGINPEDIFNAFFGGSGFPGGMGGMGGGPFVFNMGGFPAGGFGGYPGGGFGGFPGGAGGFGGMPRQRANPGSRGAQGGAGGGGRGQQGSRDHGAGAGTGAQAMGFDFSQLLDPKILLLLVIGGFMLLSLFGPLIRMIFTNAPIMLLINFVPKQYRSVAMMLMMAYMFLG